MAITRWYPRRALAAVASMLMASVSWAQAQVQTPIRFSVDHGVLELCLVRDNVLHAHFLPGGKATPPTLVMAPDAPGASCVAAVHRYRHETVLRSDAVRVVFDQAAQTLELFSSGRPEPLLVEPHLEALRHGSLALRFAHGSALYGIDGFNIYQHPEAGLLRRGIQVAKAGEQGNAGAPLVWSTAGFGVLLDSKGASFDLRAAALTVTKLSRPDPDFYLIAGAPRQILTAVADLSGHAPLFPKWSLGFINSQWGIDEARLLQIVRGYRSRHIPLDAFSLDFDWKAWGQDRDGEFRWNAQKFPDGPSGKLDRELTGSGVHLIGIMKPRIHVETAEGRYATAHRLWVADEKPSIDYFSHELVRDLDFDQAATRAWFFNPALAHSFDTGIVGWWNDEADEDGDDTEFLNMQRALYDGQRRRSDQRVWSLNRNFWLGAQRYAYGLWSGDINTGFASMAEQRPRMLSAMDVGEMWWGMDGGGFHGRPGPQNYARWIEFDAFAPVFRVHGDHGQRRQPWLYGPIAERAATRAIRLRYALLPYIYSYAWRETQTGLGLVLPLTFDWPDDPHVRNDAAAWMFGDWLLVSPVVQQDAQEERVYLPQGVWTSWSTGDIYLGGRTVTVPVDSKTWSDIPLFIRQGAIIPTQEVMDYVGEHRVNTLSVSVFPAAQPTSFDYYDDDGATYAYQHGAYFVQRLSVRTGGHGVNLETGTPSGTYRPEPRNYLFAVHRVLTQAVKLDDHRLPEAPNLAALRRCRAGCWTIGGDRFGGVTYVKVPVGATHRLQLQDGAGRD
ncbi:MAG: glycoside hydrolase family 31 protein [Steroidobacteraceae bacterium]